MNKSLTIPSLITALGLAATIPAQAADIKVGFVDMNKVFSSYERTKTAEASINESRAQAKKELDQRGESYKEYVQTINKLNQEIEKPELTQAAKEKKLKERDEKLAELQKLDREVKELQQTREKQLQEQAVRMRNGIVEEIRALIDERVKKEQFDLVLDKSGNSLNGVPIILYSKDSSDFSDDIIAQLNAKLKAEGGDKKEEAKPADTKKKK